MYVNILGHIMTAGRRKRMHGGSAKARLHPDCPVTDLLAHSMDLIYAHLQLLTNKTSCGSHGGTELNKQNVWEGTRKEEKSMSK